jgi:hypothetical protein
MNEKQTKKSGIRSGQPCEANIEKVNIEKVIRRNNRALRAEKSGQSSEFNENKHVPRIVSTATALPRSPALQSASRCLLRVSMRTKAVQCSINHQDQSYKELVLPTAYQTGLMYMEDNPKTANNTNIDQMHHRFVALIFALYSASAAVVVGARAPLASAIAADSGSIWGTPAGQPQGCRFMRRWWNRPLKPHAHCRRHRLFVLGQGRPQHLVRNIWTILFESFICSVSSCIANSGSESTICPQSIQVPQCLRRHGGAV